jgi:hypothetical protein
VDSLNVSDKKNNVKYRKICRECPQTSAKKTIGMLQTGCSIREARLVKRSMLLSIIQVLGDVVVLIMSSITINSYYILQVARQLNRNHKCISELFQVTGNVTGRHKQPGGRVTSLHQYVHV